MEKIQFIAIVGMVWLLTACSDQTDATNQMATVSTDTVMREVDFAQVSRGGSLFAANCAECHGTRGEGAPNWRTRDADGLFPAPPLNGTGHAWHHPQKMLHHVIKYGSPGGQGRMPAWSEKLSDEEISAVIAWFKSKWPDQVYATWYQMDQRARSGS